MRVPANRLFRLPNKAGIYFFKDKEENILYIGISNNLNQRIKSTHNKLRVARQKGLKSVQYFILKFDERSDVNFREMGKLETLAINFFKPILNIKKNGTSFSISGERKKALMNYAKSIKSPKAIAEQFGLSARALYEIRQEIFGSPLVDIVKIETHIKNLTKR